ncbi:Vps62-related protein [Achromobacter sp. Marseille-Q0513]|uniref:Vps62-related protein n=1 Tax=Achromobacter sp. Marseille-Q0513 TaxID=2829161 RepID=UPI001B90BC96|nr:Vps62-related protein [Achromobacter sp. Marseille-Q0513]MBR8656125.1 Vps62-related protein [Achromobacter sp. Marseille-Q0513]
MPDSALIFSTTSDFVPVPITDKGSGATSGISFWQPVLPGGEWCYLGFFGAPNYNVPSGPQVIVKPTKTPLGNPNPPLKPPQGFVQAWTCIDHDQSSNLGIYNIQAPPGYIGLGCIAVPDFNTPPVVTDYLGLMCVRHDLCKSITVDGDNLVWTDNGSKAPTDVSIWLLPNAKTCFATVSETSYPPSAPAYDVVM